MILNCEEFQNAVSKISSVVTFNKILACTGHIVLVNDGTSLSVCYTNGDYFVKKTVGAVQSGDAPFEIAVSADKLKTTVLMFSGDTINLTYASNELKLTKQNGGSVSFEVFDSLSEIKDLFNAKEFDSISYSNDCEISANILNAIATKCPKELSKSHADRGAMDCIYKYICIDDETAITFSYGACLVKYPAVTGLVEPFAFSMDDVGLFKIFNSDTIRFKSALVHDTAESNKYMMRLESDDTVALVRLADADKYAKKIPVTQIKAMMDSAFPNEVSLSKADLSSVVRLGSVVADVTDSKEKKNTYLNLNFAKDRVTFTGKNIADSATYVTSTIADDNFAYELKLRLFDVCSCLEQISADTITLKFGNGKSVLFADADTKIVTPVITTAQ